MPGSFDDDMADGPSHNLTQDPISGSVDIDMVDATPNAAADNSTQQMSENNTSLAEETVGYLRKTLVEIDSSAPVCQSGTSSILNHNTPSPFWDMKVTRTYIDYTDDELSKKSKRLKSSNGSRITIYEPVRKLKIAERSSNFGQVCVKVYTTVQCCLLFVILTLLQLLISVQEMAWVEAEEAFERKTTPVKQLDANTEAAGSKDNPKREKLQNKGSSALTLDTDLGHSTMGYADIPTASEQDSDVALDDYFADDEASSPTRAPTPPPPSPQIPPPTPASVALHGASLPAASQSPSALFRSVP